MTSKLKCPVCGKTELIRMFNPLTGKYFEDYDCPFRLCNFRGNKVAVDALIQAKQDLKIARQVLVQIAELALVHDDISIADEVVGVFDALNQQDFADKIREQIDHIADVSKMVEHKE